MSIERNDHPATSIETIPGDAWGIARLRQRIMGFPKSKRGVAAIEFSIIAPFMIALWLGSAELTQGVSADRKVSHAASALADLVTQQTNLTQQEMDDIMDATVAIMLPFSTNDLSIQIAGVAIDDDGNTEVMWSEARGTGAPQVGGSYDIPQALLIPDTFLVAATLAYAYTPPTMHVVTGELTLEDSFYLRPRRSAEITYDP